MRGRGGVEEEGGGSRVVLLVLLVEVQVLGLSGGPTDGSRDCLRPPPLEMGTGTM